MMFGKNPGTDQPKRISEGSVGAELVCGKETVLEKFLKRAGHVFFVDFWSDLVHEESQMNTETMKHYPIDIQTCKAQRSQRIC